VMKTGLAPVLSLLHGRAAPKEGHGFSRAAQAY
jgi:hypothetical protein